MTLNLPPAMEKYIYIFYALHAQTSRGCDIHPNDGQEGH